MKYIKRKIMALLLCLSLTTNQAFAVPVAVPIIFGGLAAFTTIAIALGYQTSDSQDFREMYSYLDLETKTEMLKASATATYVLTSLVLTKINDIMTTATNGVRNSVVRTIKLHRTADIAIEDPEKSVLSISRSIRENSSIYSAKVTLVSEGYVPIKQLCYLDNVKAPNGVNLKASTSIKIGSYYYRVLYDWNDGQAYQNGNVYVQRSLNGNEWEFADSVLFNNIVFSFADNDYLMDRQKKSALAMAKLTVNSSNQIMLSTLYHSGHYQTSTLRNTVIKFGGSPVTINDDSKVVSAVNSDRLINVLPVTTSKLVNKTINGTRSLTEADVTYSLGDIKAVDYAEIDPIVKNPSQPGGNTGGTDMSLWDWLKAGISTIIEVLRSIPTAVNNIGTNIVKAVEFVPTAINNIGTNIVTAVNAIPSAVHSIGNDIVGKLNDIPQAIATSIAGAFEGVANLSMNMSNDLKNLFIPDPTLLQQKYNKLSLDFTNKLGVIRQSFDLMFKLVAQDFKVKQPSLKITLYPPYGDGSTVELVDWSFFNQYWQTYQNIASAIVWFLFFRKVVINSNEYFGGGK